MDISSRRRGRFKQLIAAERDEVGECLAFVLLVVAVEVVLELTLTMGMPGVEAEGAKVPPEIPEVTPLRKREAGDKRPVGESTKAVADDGDAVETVAFSKR